MNKHSVLRAFAYDPGFFFKKTCNEKIFQILRKRDSFIVCDFFAYHGNDVCFLSASLHGKTVMKCGVKNESGKPKGRA